MKKIGLLTVFGLLFVSPSVVIADNAPLGNLNLTQIQETQQSQLNCNKGQAIGDLKAPGRKKRIANGTCCAYVGNVCITVCSNSNGCTGNGDCVVKTTPTRK
ncbi:hypothetical protein PI95_005015 [Hassallia byssoidea VB512170]|uniref:Uncharacterized protein n=1 Tax=Hassallia byssoidea VB512170 TaxID=1304833 RepID=A0A846H499_9CYAN|nr:hypothetical protein [Hassalia byssoidea]NEU71953.1 hypothetical protein [Hassalia byssoidea VB512170]